MVKKSIFYSVLLIPHLFGENNFHSDPDILSTGFGYGSGLNAKVGELYETVYFSGGAFIELKNEKRFNESVFPNHNWRGFINAGGNPIGFIENISNKYRLYLGYEHESAHATMGIIEPTSNYLDMIYDHKYRSLNMNSFFLKNIFMMERSLYFKGLLEYQVFFISRNSVELNTMKTAFSHGMSLGLELTKTFKRAVFVVSIFDRLVFEGNRKHRGPVHIEEKNSYREITQNYPVISRLNTFSVSLGAGIHLKKIRRKLMFDVKYLYGNKGGYVDSRQIDSLLYAGISFSR